ncbi:MAG: hypothetical protein ABIU05_10635 [Nitrospirales bacterium]
MLRSLTFKILAALIAAYLLILAPALAWPGYLDSPSGLLVLIPFFTVHILNKAGVPGVLEHDGYCGWGICSPTPLGLVLSALLLLALAWIVSGVIAWLMLRNRSRRA